MSRLEDIVPAIRQHAQKLLGFIDTSPSPWHAVDSIEKLLLQHSFAKLDEAECWPIEHGGRYYITRDMSSIIFFIVGQKPIYKTGFRIVGAHTDSPGLRVKPNAANCSGQMVRIGVEVYGGPILATFTDRDLSLAGRVSFRTKKGQTETKLVKFDHALLRLPNLAIHMNRKVNEEGLRLHKQHELPLLLSVVEDELPAKDLFYSLLADNLNRDPEQILAWELNVFDTQKGVLFGPRQEFIANSQLDNLASCHAGLSALLNTCDTPLNNTNICAFFDHEEIGSESAKGAYSSFLPNTLERIALAGDVNQEDYKRALAQSFLISADMAHAFQPNFSSAYDPDHHAIINAGPVIKINANNRYTSNSISEAKFIEFCLQADVPYQKYSHRSNIPCGSTIGPIASAGLGIRSVDVGNPMWAMHSIRESAGVLDHTYLTKALENFFRA